MKRTQFLRALENALAGGLFWICFLLGGACIVIGIWGCGVEGSVAITTPPLSVETGAFLRGDIGERMGFDGQATVVTESDGRLNGRSDVVSVLRSQQGVGDAAVILVATDIALSELPIGETVLDVPGEIGPRLLARVCSGPSGGFDYDVYADAGVVRVSDTGAGEGGSRVYVVETRIFSPGEADRIATARFSSDDITAMDIP